MKQLASQELNKIKDWTDSRWGSNIHRAQEHIDFDNKKGMFLRRQSPWVQNWDRIWPTGTIKGI